MASFTNQKYNNVSTMLPEEDQAMLTVRQQTPLYTMRSAWVIALYGSICVTCGWDLYSL